MTRSLLVAALVLFGCTATSAPPPVKEPAPDPASPGAAGARSAASAARSNTIAELAALRDATEPTSPEVARARLGDVEALLASADPDERDGIGYALLARWLVRDATLDDRDARALRERLVVRLGGETVFERSFAALALSLVAAREVATPVWTDAELDAQCAAAAAYAAREDDLRGWTGAETGWAHPAAHTSDWIKFLGRHPKLTAAQANVLLDAIVSLAARSHGFRFRDGEDERMASAVMSVLRRGAVDDAALDAWLARLAAPLAAGWPEPFDETVFWTQRNARDLLVSLHFQLSFDPAPGSVAALARVNALITAP